MSGWHGEVGREGCPNHSDWLPTASMAGLAWDFTVPGKLLSLCEPSGMPPPSTCSTCRRNRRQAHAPHAGTRIYTCFIACYAPASGMHSFVYRPAAAFGLQCPAILQRAAALRRHMQMPSTTARTCTSLRSSVLHATQWHEAALTECANVQNVGCRTAHASTLLSNS